MGRMGGIPKLLLLLSASLPHNAHAQDTSKAYRVEDVPNPMTDFKACNRDMPSEICDPDGKTIFTNYRKCF